MVRRAARGAAALAALTAGCAAPAPQIELRAHGGREVFSVVGLDPAALDALARRRPSPEQWSALFAVTLEQNRGAPLPGHHELARHELLFVPRFPLQQGLTYRAVFDPAGLPAAPDLPRLERRLVLAPEPPAAPAAVTAIYPSSATLAENTLRFYLHFATPMRQGDVYAHLRLVRDDGVEVPWPFLEIGEELWDPTGTRLTLLCDPGRVKRGLRPREEDGPILEEGRTFALVVASTWRDAAGRALGAGYEHEFAVHAPDASQPDPRRWRLSPPGGGTRDPLTVHFAQPLDHALLHRMLWVLGPDGPLTGDITIADHETTWRFTPRTPWRPGDHRLIADTELEDPSGNSIRAPFEVDATEDGRRQPETETARVPFRVGASR